MDETSSPKSRVRKQPNWGLGIALGVGLGVSFGAAMHNMGVGLCLGISFAVIFAYAFAKGPDDDASAGPTEDDAPPQGSTSDANDRIPGASAD